MSKIADRKNSGLSQSTDKKKPKSNEKQIKSQTITREIVIKTQEPDIPQITIMKVQKLIKNGFESGIANLQRVFHQVQLKNLYWGLCKILNKNRSSKLHFFNVNKLVNVLRGRQKRLIAQSWNKLMKIKVQKNFKLNTIRLISKISLVLISKVNRNAFEAIKSYIKQNSIKNVAQISQLNIKKVEEEFQRKLSSLKSQQFSQKFMILCKKLIKLDEKRFQGSLQSELEPGVIKQIERFKQSRKDQTSPLNNQTVLIVMNNNLLTSKRIKKELEENQQLEKIPQQDLLMRLRMYQKISQQFIRADDQIRESFEKYQRVDELQLVKIVEKQLKIWNKNKQNPLYESRLFISAIIVKIIKDGQKPLDQFIQILGQLYQSFNDMDRLQEFRRSLNTNQKSSALLAQIIKKFMQRIQVGMTPIIQRQFSQNQQIIMEEIKYIVSQVRVFMSKFSNPTQRVKMKKIFSIKRAKAPEQLKQFYAIVNQLIAFILNSSSRDTGQGNKKTEIVLKVLNMFKDCLIQDNYQKWENFLNSQVNKEQHKSLLDVLDKINDILNDKIKNETDPKIKQIENLRKGQEKIKSQNNVYKIKITELEKTIKSLQVQRSKSNQNKKQKSSVQLDKKYNQLVEKYKNLQNQLEKQRKLSQQKAQKSQKTLEQLHKKLQLKDEQIGKIQKQTKGLREKSVQKQKKDEQIKRINMLAEKKFKELQKAVQKLKQELEQKNRVLNQNEQKLKKYENTVKKYENQLESLLNKNIQVDQNDYNSLIQTNEQLNKKIVEMKIKIDRVVSELENKDNELQNIRNNLVNQQTKQASLQKSRAEYEALVRKINVLDNTVQNLKHELELKKKELSEQRRGKETQSGKKPKIPTSKIDKKTGSSVDLIKQLNKQLQKLKRNQVTLQQINKELQKAHNKGQDVQNLISSVEIQNKEYKRSLNQKQKIIYDLQIYITKLESQINILKNNQIILQNQSKTKQQKIIKLQTSLKQRQAIANKNEQNKRDYIKKLQNIVNQLNSEIALLKNREIEAPSFNTTETDTYENLINQLKQANQRFNQLELVVLNNQKSYAQQRQQFRRQIQDLLNNGQKWQLQKIKLTLELTNLQNEILKKQFSESNIEQLKYKWIEDIKTSWEQQRQRWIQDYNNWSIERQGLYKEYKNSELQRQRLNNQTAQWILQREKFMKQKGALQEQIRKLKQTGNTNWIQEKQRLLLEINIRMEGQKNKWLEQSINQRQKYKREIINWQNQRQKWLNLSKQSENKIKSLQFQLKKSIDRQNNLNLQSTTLSNQINSLQFQLKKSIDRQNNLNLQSTTFLQQINSLNSTIQELQYQISISTTTTTNQALINNIILLLSNIGDNFVRINPKPNGINDKTGEQIRQDLIRIKEKYWNQESQIFIQFQDYMKKYIQNDIQRYRFQLKAKIQELTALRDRLQEYINSQVQTSKTHLNYKYKFESVEKSTASKTIYETPSKSHQKITLISGQIRQKTKNAERLYESEYIKKY